MRIDAAAADRNGIDPEADAILDIKK